MLSFMLCINMFTIFSLKLDFFVYFSTLLFLLCPCSHIHHFFDGENKKLVLFLLFLLHCQLYFTYVQHT